ncbi:MAG: lysylphosphatidylglycerol synthase domain-containing protein [Pigmentiphaga sp.]|nr:flippase-like domain-containing protein [Xanthomonadales bacterium]MBN8768424.1 flippase-like domain-containing protein [Stenotrophomonas sp.]
MNSFLRHVVVRALMLLALTWMGWLIWKNWPAVAGMASTAQWGLLALALVALALANVGMALVFAGFVSRASGDQVPTVRVVGTFLLSQIAKYVPGKIWSVAMQAAMLQSPKATKGVLLANIELTIVNLLLVSGAGVAFWAWTRLGATVALVVFMATWCIAGWACRLNSIRLMGAVVGRFAPRFRHMLSPPSGEREKSGVGRHAGLLLFLSMYCVGWWLLVMGATTLDARVCMEVVAALSLSYIIGVVSPMPAGVGAREGAIVLLAPAVGVSHASMAAIAIATRVAMLALDAIIGVVGAILLVLDRYKRRRA